MSFGKTKDSIDVELITLENSGYKVNILTLGAAVQSFIVPLKDGKTREIIASSDRIEGYIDDKTYKGQVVAPFANRIKGAKYTFLGKEYNCDKNEGENNLHSGSDNLGSRVWSLLFRTENGCVLNCQAREGSFPANVSFTVTYTLIDGSLIINYTASSDNDTIINPTNHTFFNLNGLDSDARELELRINASKYIKCDDNLLPISIEEVDDNLDFRKSTRIKDRLNGEYDHCYILDSSDACTLKGKDLILDVKTDRPCLQLYTGKYFNSSYPTIGSGGPFCSIALETTSYIDAVNTNMVDKVYLKKGDVFKSKTIYRVRSI